MQHQIPAPLIAVVAEIFSDYYTHAQIDSRFLAAGLPTPQFFEGNKQQKCHRWLLAANGQSSDPLSALAKLVEDVMEVIPDHRSFSDAPVLAHRERIKSQLANLGFSYHIGGHILQLGATAASRTLEQITHERDLKGVHREFERIFLNLESDPEAALTASCALLEALFKGFISDEGLSMPADESVLPLWKVVRTHLRLDPGQVDDEGLKKVLSGLASIVDGTASLRTRRGSAHGHDTRASSYKIEGRHARLTAHSAMTLATFFMEVVQNRTQQRKSL